MTARIARGGGQLCLEVTDSSHVGACRRAAQRLAEAWRFDSTSAGRVGIVATELATNLLRHGGGGELFIQPIEFDAALQIELLAVDRGPGMHTVQGCMQDGFSTGGTAGTGLGAVQRMASVFDIYSREDAGCIVLARVSGTDKIGQVAPPRSSALMQFGTISVAMRGELECGDNWSIAHDGSGWSVLVVDGLGHGALAASAASAAVDAYAEKPFSAPEETMRRLHSRLGGTRGAAAACALFDESASRVHYAGIGNIAGWIVAGGNKKGMLSHNGTLGLVLARSQAFQYDWPTQGITILHSDGVSSRWSLAAYPGLFGHHPAVIAAALFRDWSRGRDDSTVVVVRQPQ